MQVLLPPENPVAQAKPNAAKLLKSGASGKPQPIMLTVD
jgi:hypothetical protein